MNEVPERILRFERCFNFRDLGGYIGRDRRPVRWRRLFRSSTPEYMTEADAVAVASLNLGLVIDFRGERFPTSGPVTGSNGARLTLAPPSVRRDDPEYERYRVAPPSEALPEVLERYGFQFAAALSAMAQHPDANILFHCRLGKDRTGVFAALVLKVLGVSDDDVLQDYRLTTGQEPFCRAVLQEYDDDEEAPSREPRVAKEPPSREAMEGVLQRLAGRYGGAHAYFARYGVPEALIDAFVGNALEPAAGDLPRPQPSGEPVPG